MLKPKLTPRYETVQECYINPPSTTQTATYNNTQYQLITKHAPIIFGELFDQRAGTRAEDSGPTDHLERKGPATVNIEGEQPIQTTAWQIRKIDINGELIPQGETWRPLDPKQDNIIYVDVTEPVQNQSVGYKFFDIYLKANSAIPDFIQNYCNKNLPTKPLILGAAGQTETLPPQTVDFNGEKFYLFSYETTNSPAFTDVTQRKNASGGFEYAVPDITVSVNGVEHVYSAYYVEPSFIQYLALVDKDPIMAQKYQNTPLVYKYVRQEFYNPNNVAPPAATAEKDLQLRPLPLLTVNPWSWWSPECKPAIYLYPTQPTDVWVKVKPEGFLTYTDPLYPRDGWQVTALPTGQLLTNGKSYDYLYYESKINDSAIEKPTQGYVVPTDQLDTLYQQILPELGLNPTEVKDFRDYWRGILPNSPYYFVGVMTESAIEKIEPLTIFPKPDTEIRVRIYFQPLVQPIAVEKPTIKPITRDGFTMVEWGGLVKNDPNHPFTCSQ